MLPFKESVVQSAFTGRAAKAISITISLVLLALLGAVDAKAPPEVSFAVFYYIPIFFATWFVGSQAGLLIACLSTLTWLLADEIPRGFLHVPMITVWNLGIKGSAFFGAYYLFSKLKQAYERQIGYALRDPLTGIANRRAFVETLEREILRARRLGHPLTLAFVDIDDFKKLNDEGGHEFGDTVLCFVAELMEHCLREMDLVARIGGDEFAILLPAVDPDGARAVMRKIQEFLTEGAQLKNWPLSLSIGMITHPNASLTADQMLRQADLIMYEVKKGGKNAVAHRLAEELPQSRAC